MGRFLNLGDEVARLGVRDRQLVVEFRDDQVPPRSAPCEDLDVVVLDTLKGVELDLHTLRTMLECGTALVVSDRKRLPAGLLLPFTGTLRHGAILEAQSGMSRPRRKRAWQALVEGKLRSQATVLGPQDQVARRLLAMARSVRSGDPDNLEAQAARLYWPRLLSDGHRRQPRSSTGLNAALDYGYAVLRALLARAAVAAGLHPAIPVWHSARVNPFALIDDLMEPLRPLVDRRIRMAVPSESTALTPALKRGLLEFVTETVMYQERRGPLPEVAERYADRYRRYVEGLDTTLDTPSLIEGARAQ